MINFTRCLDKKLISTLDLNKLSINLFLVCSYFSTNFLYLFIIKLFL